METFTNYHEFVNFAKKCYIDKQTRFLKLLFTEQNIVATDATTQKIVFTYTFEEKAICDFFVKLFEIDMALIPVIKTIYVSSLNNFQFIMNHNVLNLILTHTMLEAQGKETQKQFKLKSKNGKIRDIIAPADELKPILQDINTIFQSTYDSRNSTFQVAYKKGKSIKNNAEPHKNNKFVYKIDLHNFFNSCKRERVSKYTQFLFQNTVNSEFVHEKFLDIILADDALYIGNPVSGTLANAIISKPVEYIRNICNKFNISFTVYADDMTFSSEKFIEKQFVVDIFNKAFQEYEMDSEFSLSLNKCYGLSSGRRFVTGVVINNDNEITCHRQIYMNIRQTLYQLNNGDESHLNYGKLRGNIAFMMMLDETGKLKRLLTKYKAVVLKYNLLSAEKLREYGV